MPDGVSLFHESHFDPAFEISKVFICPTYSFETTVENVKKVVGHSDLPRGEAH